MVEMSVVPTRVLIVEDNPADAQLIRLMLAEALPNALDVITVERMAAAVERLTAERFDVVLLDLSLPDTHGLETLVRAREYAGPAPIIVLTGVDDAAAGLEALHLGAQDYITKDELDPALLARAVRYAIERARATDALRTSEQQLARIIETNPQGIAITDAELRFVRVNAAAEMIFGAPRSAVIGRSTDDVPWRRLATDGQPLPPDAHPHTRAKQRGVLEPDVEYVVQRPDGSRVDVCANVAPLFDERGVFAGTVGIFADVTARRRADRVQHFIAEATRMLSESLEYDATLTAIARLAVPFLADWCVVDVLEDDGSARRVAQAHTDPMRLPLLEQLEARYPVDPSAERGVAIVLRTGRSALHTVVSESVLAAVSRDDEHRELLRALGFDSAICVPLVTRARTLGALTLVRGPDGGRYGEDDFTLAQDLAGRAALAVDNARLHRELAARKEDLQRLVERLFTAQEEERRHVAYDLHDGLAQMLAGSYQYLQAFAAHHRPRRPEAQVSLSRALDLTQRTMREARRVVAGLRPTALDDFGLAAALREEVRVLHEDGWQVTFEADLGSERLPAAVETALFRVGQEAITNARKHAGDARLAVTLSRRDRRIRLVVQDWGRGFDPAAVRATANGPGERIGLAGMQERLALLDGRLEVCSQPGAGTCIIAVVPDRTLVGTGAPAA